MIFVVSVYKELLLIDRSRFQNSSLKERGFSYLRKSNSSGGLESPPSVSFESAQGGFEITLTGLTA
jgi:hypothetical protein